MSSTTQGTNILSRKPKNGVSIIFPLNVSPRRLNEEVSISHADGREDGMFIVRF